MDFICTVCKNGRAEDHRWCLVSLFKENKIKSVKDWESAGKSVVSAIRAFQAKWRATRKPKTIKKGRVRARIPKE